jgi:molecular chaperone DnaK
MLTGLRRAPRGEVEIKVAFDISADGIVSVSAEDMETGQQQTITVTATSGLTEDEIRKMVEENRDYMVELRDGEDFERDKQQVEKILEEIEGMFVEVEKVIAGSDFGQDAVKKAHVVVERARASIVAKDRQALIELKDALGRTANMFKGVLAKTRMG